MADDRKKGRRPQFKTPPIGSRKSQRVERQGGFIKPPIVQKEFGLDPDAIKPKPIPGGKGDANRVRVVKGFFDQIPSDLILSQDLTEEVPYTGTLETKIAILTQVVPENRTFMVDDVRFFAREAFGVGLIPAGIVEGSLQCFFRIGEVSPVEISTTRVQAGLPVENRAYFPFLNERVGQTELPFIVRAKSGRRLEAFYINRVAPPVPIATVGVRIRGWLIDSNIVEEILEQQR